MRGRKPKPLVLHERHGTLNVTDHRSRLEGGEPVPETVLGAEAPAWMTEDQKIGWNYAVEHAPRDVLKAIDGGVLAVWVEAEDRHRRACIALAKHDQANPDHPMLSKTKEGNLIQCPHVGVINRAAQLMIKAASELGFSPASRPRLAVATGMDMDAPGLGKPVRRDDLDSFLKARPGPATN